VQRRQRWRLGAERGGELHRAVGRQGGDAALAARAVDHAEVELLAHGAPQDGAQMLRAWVGGGQRTVEFGAGEEEEVHGGTQNGECRMENAEGERGRRSRLLPRQPEARREERQHFDSAFPDERIGGFRCNARDKATGRSPDGRGACRRWDVWHSGGSMRPKIDWFLLG
jgi:hypothetical protein